MSSAVRLPASGADELFDASPVVREFTNAFLKNKAFTNLPRKFNVAITACTASCTHAETQDVALTPAIKIVDGDEIKGFNVAVGGKDRIGRPSSGHAAWRVRAGRRSRRRCAAISRCSFATTDRAARGTGHGSRF